MGSNPSGITNCLTRRIETPLNCLFRGVFSLIIPFSLVLVWLVAKGKKMKAVPAKKKKAVIVVKRKPFDKVK